MRMPLSGQLFGFAQTIAHPGLMYNARGANMVTMIGRILLVSGSAVLALAGCSKDTPDVLAPYGAQRSIFITTITQNARPDMQWLGGRAMAVGANRGAKAALDSTLVWLQTGAGNSVSSYVTFGKNNDAALLSSFGATAADSLDPDAVYTFWVAAQSAFLAKLDSASSSVNLQTYSDTSVTADFMVRGQCGGEGGLSAPVYRMSIRREQTVLGDRFTITWTPSTAAFRNLGVTANSTGSWDNPLWLVSNSGTIDRILPPVVVGIPPAGTTEATPYVEGSIVPGQTYTIWMTNRNWVGTFNLNSKGYAFFRFTLTR